MYVYSSDSFFRQIYVSDNVYKGKRESCAEKSEKKREIRESENQRNGDRGE